MNGMIDDAKQRREFMRWVLLLGMYNARPIGIWEEPLLAIVQAIYRDCTKLEMRREFDYLYDRKLVEIQKYPDGRWFGELSNNGVDYVEYTIPSYPGIARPEKNG